MRDKTTDELAKILWDYNRLDSRLEKGDVIMALGSHDIRVAERASQIFFGNYAPVLVFSGGFGRLTGDWSKPEAEVFADRALEMGVPKDKIIVENRSTNTAENMVFSMKVLEDKSINPKKVIVVTKPYMERRAFAHFKYLFPEIEILSTSPQLSYEQYPNAMVSKKEMINVMVGDTQRIKLYPAKGFMISQEIPDEVWQAYEELVRRGFTSQLVKE